MAPQRFFLQHIDPDGGKIIFPEKIAHQIEHVLRLQPGDMVVVLDGEGTAYQVRLDAYGGSQLTATIESVGEVKTALPVHITLFFPLSRREKVEWILQKGTEVGVSAFRPFTSARSLVQDTLLTPKKMHRWEAIIREAAEQSGRATLPALHDPQHLSAIISSKENPNLLDVSLLAAVSENKQTIANVLAASNFKNESPSIGLFIGAEGGFSEEELDAFQALHISAVTLGNTVLRIETAAIVFPALIMDHFYRITCV